MGTSKKCSDRGPSVRDDRSRRPVSGCLRGGPRRGGHRATSLSDPEPRDFELKGPQDYLTEADGHIERLIRRLARKFPADAFFGEECEDRRVGTCTWIVDPIDGTANFARGIPHFGISIGMLHEGEPALGIVCIPMSHETFAARRGGVARP